jgi:hypothetical protein
MNQYQGIVIIGRYQLATVERNANVFALGSKTIKKRWETVKYMIILKFYRNAQMDMEV